MAETATQFLIAKCQFCGKLNRVDAARVADLPKCGDCATPMRVDRPLKISDSEFDRVIQGTDVLVLVDFYADWCGPCRMMATTLDEFALASQGQVLVVKVDTDANPSLSQRFEIRGIPTLMAFRNGQEIGRHVGLADRKVMEALTAGGRAGTH
ncbi:MAG TPA: thioredoxin [Gemmatimonadales bacterium]|nr:thioredoxin [Gemmatimonadales bacterium]